MGRPYSIDLRERVVAAVGSGGLSCRQAAAQFGVGISTAINLVRRLRETGSVRPGQTGGHKPKSISGKHRSWLLARIKAEDFTLRGLVAAALAERGLKVDYRTMWSFVHGEQLSFKKSMVAGERDRADIARRRARWVDPSRLVFIDETWARTDMASLRGWAPRGSRLPAKVQRAVILPVVPVAITPVAVTIVMMVPIVRVIMVVIVVCLQEVPGITG